MDGNEFIYKSDNSKILEDGSFTWKAPSNIALVKYWGKRELQEPENPSISFTLSNCFTETTLEFTKNKIPKIFSVPDNNTDFNNFENSLNLSTKMLPYVQVWIRTFNTTGLNQTKM